MTTKAEYPTAQQTHRDRIADGRHETTAPVGDTASPWPLWAVVGSAAAWAVWVVFLAFMALSRRS